jgi:hypothetical protein
MADLDLRMPNLTRQLSDAAQTFCRSLLETGSDGSSSSRGGDRDPNVGVGSGTRSAVERSVDRLTDVLQKFAKVSSDGAAAVAVASPAPEPGLCSFAISPVSLDTTATIFLPCLDTRSVTNHGGTSMFLSNDQVPL